MKTKLFLVFLTLFVLTAALAACVPEVETVSGSSLPPLNTSSNPSESSNNESSGEEASSNTESVEQSKNESSESSDVSSDESSEISAVIENPELPYKNISSLTAKGITADSLDEYFKDSMFIGDSIMVHYKNFTDARRTTNSAYMSNSILLCASAYSALHDLTNRDDGKWLPKYKGQQMKAADAVKESGVKTVYLSMMALNEIGLYNITECVQKAFESKLQLMDEIREKSPDVKFVIISNTYMIRSHNGYAKLNNLHLSQLNNKMLEYCTENGIDFIDVSTILVKDGVLADEYCSDPDGNGCHLVQNCYAMWTGIFRNYSFAKQNGFYKNPESMPLYEKN